MSVNSEEDKEALVRKRIENEIIFVDPNYTTPYYAGTIDRHYALFTRLQYRYRMSAPTLVAIRETFEHVAEMLPEAVQTGNAEPVLQYLRGLQKPDNFSDIIKGLVINDISRYDSKLDAIEYTCWYGDGGAIWLQNKYGSGPTTKEGFLQQCTAYHFLRELEYCAVGFRKHDREMKRTATMAIQHGSLSALHGDVKKQLMGYVSQEVLFDQIPDWFRPTLPRGPFADRPLQPDGSRLPYMLPP